MHKIESLINDHYDNVKRKVDISIETLQLNKKADDKIMKELNTKRQTILEKIEEICKLNLKNIESIQYTTDNLEDYSLEKFCFFIDITNTKGEILQLGSLIITDRFINRNICEALRKELNALPNDLNSLLFKERIVFEILHQLLFNDFFEHKEIIFDLSNKEKNILKCLNIFSYEKPLNPEDLDSIENFINTKNFQLFFNAFTKLTQRHFTHLNWLKSLYFDATSDFEADCFQALSSLEEFIFHGDESYKFDLKLIANLSTLEKLVFYGCVFETIEPKIFEKLTNLKLLIIREGGLTKLEADNLVGLSNLKYLDLTDNKLVNLDEEVFKQLKGLICLNLSNSGLQKIDVKNLNLLEKLEYLNLTDKESKISVDYENLKLPNLKFMAISSKAIPNLKFLQLRYLRVEKMERFDQKLLLNQKKLVGFCMEITDKFYNRLEKKHFSDIKTLKYLEIRYIPRDENATEFITRKDEVVFLNYKNPKFSNRQISIENFAISSAYDDFDSFLQKGIDFSPEAKSIIMAKYKSDWFPLDDF